MSNRLFQTIVHQMKDVVGRTIGVIDENGIRHVKNESAYWIPEITISEEIGGTVYTVTGTYEGEATFVRKLERIMARKFAKEMEDGNDTFTNP